MGGDAGGPAPAGGPLIARGHGMAGCLKTIVGVVVLILAIVAGVAGYSWYSRHGRQLKEAARRAREEGMQLGEETDDQSCLDEALRRHRHAGGLAQAMVDDLFLKGCLSSSEPTDGFCDGVPRRRQRMAGATWQIKRCAAAGFSDPLCRSIFVQVQEYCESDLSRSVRNGD